MKLNLWLTLVVFSLSVLVANTARAENALLDFSATMTSFSANFTQTVYDSDSVVLQESSGRVVLMRPGRFRWTYEEPIRQVIVADGITLWVYDEDIKQVTMQPQSTTLGSAPIGLLSGELAIESEFTVTELGANDGLKWFQLEPLVQDTDFQSVFIAVDDDGLRAMELRDNFDQATQIRFENFNNNAEIDDRLLRFEPPAGADVVGEAGVAAVEKPMQNPQSDSADAVTQQQGAVAAEKTPLQQPAIEKLAETTEPPEQGGAELSDSATSELPVLQSESGLQQESEVQFEERSVAKRPVANAAETVVEPSKVVDELPSAQEGLLPVDPLLVD